MPPPDPPEAGRTRRGIFFNMETRRHGGKFDLLSGNAKTGENSHGPPVARDVTMKPRELNDISYLIIQSAIQVHRELGPGLLESVYRACLLYELRQRALATVAERLLSISYRGAHIEGAYRLDLLVEDQVVALVSQATEQAARTLDQLSCPCARSGCGSRHERAPCRRPENQGSGPR